MDDLKNNKFLITITPVFFFIYLVFNGVLGVKFGVHWDEWVFISTANESIESGVYLPHLYIYPSFCYYLVLLSTGVYKIIFGINDAKLLFSDQNFYHYIRSIFIIVSSLTVFWVYFLTMKITKNYWAALIAGLIICSSFEFSYHSRWAVSDCIATQFVILSALFLFLNIGEKNKIILSSLTAGFAAGTKYTAGIACLNILIFILSEVKFNRKNLKTGVGYFFLILGGFAAGFIITTPGVIFEYKKFTEDLIYQKYLYSSGHYGHTIQAGFNHFSKIIEYISYSLLSKNSGISLLIFLFAIIGAITVFMKKKWKVIGLFITMLVYIIYISTFNVMIVRNLLYILPFLAIFSSIGFIYISNKIQNYKFGFAYKLIILLILFYSCSRVVVASYSIVNNSQISLSRELEEYSKQNKDKEFIYSLEAVSNLKVRSDINIKPTEKSYLVFYKDEIPMQLYKANINNQFTDIIGIDDVNFDYYPTWCGKNRLVVMKYLNASDDILFYALKGKKSLINHKIICDAENLSANKSSFLSTELINDSIIDSKSASIFFEGVNTRNDKVARSGKYSFKLDKSSPLGIRCKVQVKSGNYYQFSVWRNNPNHTGCLVVDNSKDKNPYGSYEFCVSDSVNDGWELLKCDFYATDITPDELSISTSLSDSLSAVYFDDLTITSFERPEK